MPKWNRKFAGEWCIVELLEMDDEYMDEGEGEPYIRLKASYEDGVNGDYEYGISKSEPFGVEEPPSFGVARFAHLMG